MELPFAPPTSAEGFFIVPSGIRPTLQKTRIEVCPFYHQYLSISIFNYFLFLHLKILFCFDQVLCWGVRDMKRFRLLQVTSPLVELECGGNLVKTKPIQNAKKNPNFPDPVITMDVVSTVIVSIIQL